MSEKKLVVVLVRGRVGNRKEVNETLDHLNLTRKNYAIVVEDTPITRGMIQVVKDGVTWGEIDDQTYQLLIEKRGEIYQGRETDHAGKIQYHHTIASQGKKYKKYFRLNPPRKGFGRKGIKVAFRAGGALGYRGEKINDLLRRML